MNIADKVPTFFTSDIDGQTFIYKLSGAYADNYSITAVYIQVKQIHHDDQKRDFVVEDVPQNKSKSIILETSLETPKFNDSYDGQELIWYDDYDDINDIITMCVI